MKLPRNVAGEEASSGNMAQSLAMGVALGKATGAIFDFNQCGRSKAKNSGMQP
jgi:hypothetical protein